MKKIASFITILTLSSTQAFATQVKVIKTGGSRAVVEFPKGTTMKAGDVLTLSAGGGEAGEADMGGGGGGGASGSRKNFIELSSELSIPSAGFTMSPLLAAVYGWNGGGFEYGFALTLAKPASGDFSFGAGAQVDINFSENKPGAFFVPAVTVKGAYVNTASAMAFSGGLAAKIFALRQSSTAIRLEALFNFTKSSSTVGTVTTSSTSTDITVLGVGLQTYF